MKIVPSSIYEGNRLNIISPTAHELTESVPTAIYPTLDEWNNTLFDCLKPESCPENHQKLHDFLLKWNAALEPGWLRVLLSRGHYKENLVDKAFYRMHLNGGEKILVLLLLVLLQEHEYLLPIKVRQRVPNLAKAFMKTHQTISILLKKQPLKCDEMKLDNLRQLLMQSLHWRNTLVNHKSESDPLFLFIFQRENDWMTHKINIIEEEADSDLELSKWMAKKCIAPLLRYLIVTKHDLPTSDSMLKTMGLCNSESCQHFVTGVDIIPQASLMVCSSMVNTFSNSFGRFSLQSKDQHPANIIDDSTTEGGDDTSVNSFVLPEEVFLLNQSFSNDECMQENQHTVSPTETRNEASAIFFLITQRRSLNNTILQKY